MGIHPVSARDNRVWAGIGLVVVAPFALWGLFVAGLLLGASGGMLIVPASMLTIPAWVAFFLGRAVFRPKVPLAAPSAGRRSSS